MIRASEEDSLDPQYVGSNEVRRIEDEVDYPEVSGIPDAAFIPPPPEEQNSTEQWSLEPDEFEIKEMFKLIEFEEAPVMDEDEEAFNKYAKEKADEIIKEMGGKLSSAMPEDEEERPILHNQKKKHKIKNLPYFIVLIFAALSLAGTAAYFSVFGLSKIFAGASFAAIVMAGAIELGKIVAVSFTNRYWKSLKGLRVYLTLAIIIAMVVTSASIYGFLSSAYQITADKMVASDTRIEIEQSKRLLIESQVNNRKQQITMKNARIGQLNNQRDNQESRLDSLYAIHYYTTAKRTENIIARADNEIQSLTGEISMLSQEIGTFSDSLFVYDEKVLNLRNTDTSAELGPLRFTAALLDVEIDKVVAWFILMLILIFDPMAMALIIAANRLVVINKKED